MKMEVKKMILRWILLDLSKKPVNYTNERLKKENFG